MNIPKISKRLEAAASFSRRGARFADVGTDHAYLPIYLHATEGSRGVASDINVGPTERALANVISHGAKGAIDVVRTDGLNGIEKYFPEDIFILGMGGELIVKIISEAQWLKDEKKRLVLQPMTHPEAVRKYLYDNGFDIVDELIIKDEPRSTRAIAIPTATTVRITSLVFFLSSALGVQTTFLSSPLVSLRNLTNHFHALTKKLGFLASFLVCSAIFKSSQ